MSAMHRIWELIALGYSSPEGGYVSVWFMKQTFFERTMGTVSLYSPACTGWPRPTEARDGMKCYKDGLKEHICTRMPP